MTIRTVTTADYAAVEEMALALHRSAVEARSDLYAPLTEFYTPELFRQWVGGEVCPAIWLLAEEDGAPVGICLTRINETRGMRPGPEPCVDLLYVREAYRRRGIARALLEETARRARASGCRTLTLAADGYNGEARRLYERFGMTPRQIWYEKELDAAEA